MPNPIKYTAGTETQSLKKGNFSIGSGDVGKGPTSSTGFYAGVNIPSSGYTVYLNNNSLPGGLSYFTAGTDASLISQTNSLASTSFTSATQCLTYYASQTDKICFNIDYPPIVTSGLVVNVDAAFVPSYPTSGTSWYDVSPIGNIGTLINGPTFNSANGGTIAFDGTDDYVSFSQVPSLTNQLTMECWFYLNAIQSQNQNRLISNGDYYVIYLASTSQLSFYMANQGGYIYSTGNSFLNSWNHIVATYNGTNRAIYINGILKTTSNASGNVPNGNILNIGAYQNESAYTINGRMGQMRIYNRGLSSSEVTQNYEATGTRYVSLSVQYLVVAGGGSGGGSNSYPAGGGGAGGLLTGLTTTLSTNTNYTVTVGGGGSVLSNGSNSVFNDVLTYGGGHGGCCRSTGGASGGSGGGGATNYPPDLGVVKLTPAGSGVSGQGNSGGVGKSVYNNTGPNGDGIPSGAGGGGGAGAVGGTGTTTPYHKGGDGGVGLYFSEYSSLGGLPSGWFAGGGGGSNNFANGANNSIGLGANGGGGNASAGVNLIATPGGVNTGGGGGGAGYIEANGGSAGGSGIVILKIPDVYTAKFSSGVTSSVIKTGGYKYYKITATSTTSETVSFS